MNLIKIKFSTTAEPPGGDVEVIEIYLDDDDNNNNTIDAEVINIDSDDDDDDNNNNNNNSDGDDDGDGDDNGHSDDNKTGNDDSDGNDQFMADRETTPLPRDLEASSTGTEQLEQVLQATKVAFARECIEVDQDFRCFVEAVLE